MAAKRAALLALSLTLAVLAGCSAATQQSSQGQPESGSASSAVSASAGSSSSSAAEVVEPEEPQPAASQGDAEPDFGTIAFEANGSGLSVALADTDAARALADKLADGPLTLELSAYGGFEKVGPLGFSLPADDEQVTAQPGDVMLYQGSQVSVFTGSNTWAYTRLGHIEGIDASELMAILGDGDVTATLSLG